MRLVEIGRTLDFRFAGHWVRSAEGRRGLALAGAAPDGTTLRYGEDPFIGVPYVQILGPGAAHAATALHVALEAWTEEEICAAWDVAVDVDARMLATMRVGLGAPETLDPSFGSRLRVAFTDPMALVRTSAVVASAFRAWAPLGRVRTRLATDDPDARVRDWCKRVGHADAEPSSLGH